MSSKLAIRSLLTVFMLILVLAAVSTYVTAQTAPATTTTITGCLQKGLESKGYFLITADDQHWELYPTGKVKLDEHVGQTVAVTGATPTRTAAEESKSQPYETKETGTRKHGDFQVSAVKMVSLTCTK